MRGNINRLSDDDDLKAHVNYLKRVCLLDSATGSGEVVSIIHVSQQSLKIATISTDSSGSKVFL